MSKRIENLVRQWSLSGGPERAPAPPTAECLSWADAARMASGEGATYAAEVHTSQCPRCRRLVAEFMEAREEMGGGVRLASAADRRAHAKLARPRQGLLSRRQGGRLAAAASVLLALGIGLYVVTAMGGEETRLGEVRMGLRTQIETGMTPRSALRFAVGDEVGLAVELERNSYLTVLNLEATGAVTVLALPRAVGGAIYAQGPGRVNVGPLRLEGRPGQETFFVVATSQPVRNVASRVKEMETACAGGATVEAIAEQIRGWPADVKAVTFELTAR